jgi:hypothetical protein
MSESLTSGQRFGEDMMGFRSVRSDHYPLLSDSVKLDRRRLPHVAESLDFYPGAIPN